MNKVSIQPTFFPLKSAKKTLYAIHIWLWWWWWRYWCWYCCCYFLVMHIISFVCMCKAHISYTTSWNHRRRICKSKREKQNLTHIRCRWKLCTHACERSCLSLGYLMNTEETQETQEQKMVEICMLQSMYSRYIVHWWENLFHKTLVYCKTTKFKWKYSNFISLMVIHIMD